MTIVLAGGGTAGHIMPNIALLPYLKKYFDKIYYIGGDGVEGEIAKKYGVPFYRTSAVRLDREKIVKNLKIPFVLPKSVIEAKKILEELAPDVVYSRGGYAALPSVFAAKILKIPVIAHEADTSLGVANTVCAPFCKKIFLSFENEKYEKNQKFIYTGTPVRDEIFGYTQNGAKNLLGIESSRKVLLIFGGSLGAKAINECVYSCLEKLTDGAFVLHITGKTGDKNIRRENYKATEYADDIALYLNAADAVISRAGANAAAELFALGKKTLFIPLPKAASRGDQIKNAEYYRKKGAEILLQEDMNAETLTAAASSLLSNGISYTEKNNPFERPNKKIAELIYRTAVKK
jgi:UDP-N-acetylglucosamine--N-acetylmuramyl-(pentapeptide) pyrophosphoryl-undecaprenol N-acetylglucosamine transferase